jgi:hypothetical protein
MTCVQPSKLLYYAIHFGYGVGCSSSLDERAGTASKLIHNANFGAINLCHDQI